jgi:hypothetical protein
VALLLRQKPRSKNGTQSLTSRSRNLEKGTGGLILEDEAALVHCYC